MTISPPAHLKLIELFGRVKVRGRAIGHQAGYLAILRWLQPEFNHIVQLQLDDNDQLTLSYHRQKLLQLEPELKTIETALKYLQPQRMYVIKISRGLDHWKTWSFGENKSSSKSKPSSQSGSKDVATATMWHIEPETYRSVDKPPKRDRPPTKEPSRIYYYHATGTSTKRVKAVPLVNESADQPEITIGQSFGSKTESTDGTSTDIMISDAESESYQLPDLNLDLDFEFF